MADRKRASPTLVAMNESPSPNGTPISKRRKVTPSSEMQLQLPNSLADSPGKTLSSVNSSAMVASDEFFSDHTPSSRVSSSKLTETDDVVKELDVAPLDPEMQIKGFETVDATKCNLKLFREEEEMDEFFARFEKEEEKRFAEKYNFDIVRDLPLEGRYEWVRLH